MLGMLKDLMKAVSGDSASPMGKLTKADLKSIGMSIIDGCASLILTIVQTQIVPALPSIPAMTVNFIISKFLRKWLSNGGISVGEQKK